MLCRRRGEGKSYLFAGLANGMLAAYDQSVLLVTITIVIASSYLNFDRTLLQNQIK